MILRIYCLRQWYNRSNPGAEEAAVRYPFDALVLHLELGHDPIPEETTILCFPASALRHELTKEKCSKALLEARGVLLCGGTIVDATLIAALPSTKNEAGKRDPKMHAVKESCSPTLNLPTRSVIQKITRPTF